MEITEILSKYFNQTTFFNWLTLILYMVIVFYMASLMSDTGNRVLDTVGAYKPNGFRAYIGVPIHEFGHWLFAKLFFFQVTDARFFPSKPEDNGDGRVTLGYVSYSVSSDTNIIVRALGLTLVSVGPIFSGSIVIILLGKLLCNDLIMSIYNFIQGSFEQEKSALTYIFSNFEVFLKIFDDNMSVLTAVFLVLAMVVADYMTLSKADLGTFYTGVIILTVVIFIASFIPLVNDTLTKVFGICISYVTFFGVLSLLGQLLNIGYAFIYKMVNRR